MRSDHILLRSRLEMHIFLWYRWNLPTDCGFSPLSFIFLAMMSISGTEGTRFFLPKVVVQKRVGYATSVFLAASIGGYWSCIFRVPILGQTHARLLSGCLSSGELILAASLILFPFSIIRVDGIPPFLYKTSFETVFQTGRAALCAV